MGEAFAIESSGQWPLQRFPKLVELRFFVQVHKTERWRVISAATQSLLESLGRGARVRKALAVGTR